MQAQLDTVAGVANRADQRGSAHQPFIDMVRAAAVAGTVLGERAVPRTLDGRTLMVLSFWAGVLVEGADADSTVTLEVTLTPEKYQEIRSALQNVKYAMEHMKLSVPYDE